MRIAILATHFLDYSLNLALELSRSASVMLVVDTRRLVEECDPPQLSAARARIRFVEFRQRNRVERWSYAALASAAIKWFGPDLVIAHEHGHPHISFLQERCAAKAALFLIVHDPAVHAGEDAAFAVKASGEIERQRAQATLLLAHGAWCAATLKRVLQVERPVRAMPHGPIMQPASSPSAPPQVRRGLVFGRMQAYKGLAVLLEAARALDGEGSDFQLVLAGAGPELDRLEAQFRTLPNVEIRNRYLGRAEVIELMQTSAFVLAPYTEATTSGVLAAAFANGRPAIGSRVGGIPDVLIDGVNGQLVEPGDPQSLAAAIRAFPIHSDALWRGAQRTMETTCSWTEAARVILEAHREVGGS